MADSTFPAARIQRWRVGILLAAMTPLTGCGDDRDILASESYPAAAGSVVASFSPGALRVWGDDASRQVSDAPRGTFQAIAGGSINGLAIRGDGTPVLWGTGPIGPESIPPTLATETFRAVAIGRDDAVMIRGDGTLAAFGRYVNGSRLPVGTFRSVTVAAAFGVGIRRDGTLEGWEWPHPLVAPTGFHTPAGTFQEVAASVLYGLALNEDGTLYGWGNSGVLAGWTPTRDSTIFSLPGQTFASIAAGNVHALAIRPNGTVTGWGSGVGGALEPPTHVRFKAVDAGWGFSIGLSTDGTLWGWGTPERSPFASEDWTFATQGWTRYGRSEHYYVPGERFEAIAAGAFHVMAITALR